MQKVPHHAKDIITKEAFKAITIDIAILILKLNISEDISFIDKELLRVEKREADIVVLCKIDGVEQILHIEIQNANDNTMSDRMLRYYLDIKSAYKTYKINQYVIYIGKSKLSMKNSLIDDNINFSYNIIDMHNIDCEEFIKMDTPDALVLSILYDFKNRSESEVLTYLITRLKELTQNDERLYAKFMLMMETLSSNRDLKETLKKVEEMITDTKIEDLPSFSLGMEKGISQGKLEMASQMIKEFNLSVESIALKFNLSVDAIKEYINTHNI